MKYLGIELAKPRIAVFDFTACEGCELQLANKEQTLVDFLSLVEIVNFREVSSLRSDNYEIAFIEGSISRADEVERLTKIRERAKVLVALGSCACYGGVHRLKNAYTIEHLNKTVYGDKPQETLPVRAIKEVVKVDLEIPGCPVNKSEVERIVQHVLLGLPYQAPLYPVCMECKRHFTTCMFEKGELCLGSITRAGCDAPCPAGGLGCWGCRGPAADANHKEFLALAHARGHSDREIAERLSFFGGFEGVSK
jgi:sulfhydrogenase subunit delta